MKAVFIDTSACYALFNREDPHHEEAIEFYQKGLPLVTTHAVFAELLSLLTKRRGKRLAIRCGRQIKVSQARLSIIHLSQVQEERAWELFCRFKDKDYGLVHCMSFVLVEDEDIEEAFSFVRHFAQFGFQLCPRTPTV